MKYDKLPEPHEVLQMDEDTILEWLDVFYGLDPHYHALSGVNATREQTILYYMLLHQDLQDRLIRLHMSTPPLVVVADWETLDPKPITKEDFQKAREQLLNQMRGMKLEFGNGSKVTVDPDPEQSVRGCDAAEACAELIPGLREAGQAIVDAPPIKEWKFAHCDQCGGFKIYDGEKLACPDCEIPIEKLAPRREVVDDED